LCPSYEVARTVLITQGITLDVKTLWRLCQCAGGLDNNLRGRLALSGEEKLHSHTLVVSVDGGRIRLRNRKRGRKANELKRQGYHTDWKEPKMDTLEVSIKALVTDKKKLTQALKKFTNYFAANRNRMQYAQFKAKGLPCGSGHVESAIRRVINLRLKAPGTFWLKEMAECFLFLRSQVISGRWKNFYRKFTIPGTTGILGVYYD
jgi:hypothetical protein